MKNKLFAICLTALIIASSCSPNKAFDTEAAEITESEVSEIIKSDENQNDSNELVSDLPTGFHEVNNELSSNGAEELISEIISVDEVEKILIEYYLSEVPSLNEPFLPTDESQTYERALIICDAITYKNGVIVLAERRTEGESCPSLHYIENSAIKNISGERVWYINYTFFEGEYIFFGLASMSEDAGSETFCIETQDGNIIESEIRNDKWFIIAAGSDFPKDFYFLNKDNEKIAFEEIDLFYYSDSKLEDMLSFQPMLKTDKSEQTANRVILSTRNNVAGTSEFDTYTQLIESVEINEDFSTPIGVAWRNESTRMTHLIAGNAIYIEDVDYITQVYFVDAHNDDYKADGSETLSTVSLDEIRKNDNSLPTPKKSGRYAYIFETQNTEQKSRYCFSFSVD